MRRIVEWNGRDVPLGLRDLPPGRYVLEEERATTPRDLEAMRQLAARECGVLARERRRRDR
jgi:hypothetical protein